MFPIFSIMSAVSSISVLTLGARTLLLFPPDICVLSFRAKQAAKDTIMAVLLGIEKSWDSP